MWCKPHPSERSGPNGCDPQRHFDGKDDREYHIAVAQKLFPHLNTCALCASEIRLDSSNASSHHAQVLTRVMRACASASTTMFSRISRIVAHSNQDDITRSYTARRNGWLGLKCRGRRSAQMM